MFDPRVEKLVLALELSVDGSDENVVGAEDPPDVSCCLSRSANELDAPGARYAFPLLLLPLVLPLPPPPPPHTVFVVVAVAPVPVPVPPPPALPLHVVALLLPPLPHAVFVDNANVFVVFE